MNDNKKIGFDVLENADNEKIAEMGADSPIISRSARDRMLEMSRKKYENAKASQNSEAADEDNVAYTVSGNAEIYKPAPIKRIVTAVASCAAAAVLIGTTAFLLWKKPSGKPVVPNSNVVTNVTTDTTDLTATTYVTTTTTTAVPEFTTVTTYIAKDFNITKPVPQEDIEAARDRVFDKFMNTNEYATNIQYKYLDLNHDDVPELFLYYQNAYNSAELYRYDGKNYVIDINEYGYEASYGFTSAPMISSDGSCLYFSSKEGGLIHNYVTMNSDYSLNNDIFSISIDWEDAEEHKNEPDHMYNNAYYHNRVKVSEEEYNSCLDKFKSMQFSEITDFTYYADETYAYAARLEKYEQEEREREEYRKVHPHFEDFAAIYIDKATLQRMGILDRKKAYILEYTATYCDGNVISKIDENDTYFDTEPSVNEKLGFCVDYGESDDAPCKIKVRCRAQDSQEFFDLCELEIDFKNKTWVTDSDEAYKYLSVEYCYFSETYNN